MNTAGTSTALEIWVSYETPNEDTRWMALSQRCPDISVFIFQNRSLASLENRLRNTKCRVVLLVDGDVWLGDDIAARIAEVAADLDRLYPNWGLCGNFALSSDGDTVNWFLKDVAGAGIERSDGPKPVLALGDSVLLLNTSALLNATVNGESLASEASLGAALSVACLRQGSLPLADDRLFGVHPRRQVPVPAVRNPIALLPLYDAALERARRHAVPSLAIVCRTQLDRRGMLDRAVQSFQREADDAHGLAQVSIRVVSDVSAEELDAQVRQLRDQFPGVHIDAWFFPVRSKQVSRIDLLLASVRKAETDFVWFVDDDDFLLPGALRAVARALRRSKPQLIVGHSRIFHEVWRSDDPSSAATSRPGPVYPANRVLWALGGENHTPICSAVFPVGALRERTEGVAPLGEYMEDYFLLLQLLTRGETLIDILDVELAGVSIRSSGNAVTMGDRSRWHRSQAEVVGNTLVRSQDNNPLLWRLTAELLRARTEQEQIQVIVTSRSWRWTRPLRRANALLRRITGR